MRSYLIWESQFWSPRLRSVKASGPALDRLMADAAQRKVDCIAVYKMDRYGRSVLHLNQQLAALTSYGVRFIVTSQFLDMDEKNPTSRLLLQILASVATETVPAERAISGGQRQEEVRQRLGVRNWLFGTLVEPGSNCN
jgi:site-specific DNA recombinase